MKIFNFESHFLEYYLHMHFVYITSDLGKDLGYTHLFNSRATLVLFEFIFIFLEKEWLYLFKAVEGFGTM